MTLTALTLPLQIENLRARGQMFLEVPDKYYDHLRERLKHSKVKITEDMDTVSPTLPSLLSMISAVAKVVYTSL